MNPLTNDFWQAENALLWAAIQQPAMDALMLGVGNAVDLLPPALQQLVDFDLVNQAALTWLQTYRFNQIAGITETTRVRVQQAIQQWIQAGDPLPRLIEQLTPLFGETRAEAIAITEVTRIFGQGNLAAWQGTGVVGGKRWMTAVDERVCPICWPLHNQVVEIDNGFTLSQESVANSEAMRGLLGDRWTPEAALTRAGSLTRSFTQGTQTPPAHVRCRCWLQPFVSEVLFRERVGDILADRFFAEVEAGVWQGVAI